MSDPMNTRPAAPPPEDPPPQDPPRKGASPFIWILVLIALIAFAWYFYNRNRASEAVTDLTPAAATSDAMSPGASQGADVEKVPAAARSAAKRPKTVAKAGTAITRDAALIGQPKPGYPPEAYRAREEGTVLVTADIDPSGNVASVDVARRSGSRALDRAALDEVRKWKFTPAMKQGKAVASSVQVPVDYKLDAQ